MAAEKSRLKTRAKFVKNFSVFLGIIGILISLYAYYVETSAENNKGFQALCDISETISCSKVLTSRYGKGFGLLEYVVGRDSVLNQPNSVTGMMFYLLFIILANMPSFTATKIQIVLSVFSVLVCVYLAFILVYILEDLCIVCLSTYMVNALVFVCSILKYNNSMALEKLKKSS